MDYYSIRAGDSKFKRYFAATALVALAALLRVWPLQVLGSSLAWITFYPVVMISAVYGGIYAGLLATVLSSIVVAFFWQLLVASPFIFDTAQ